MKNFLPVSLVFSYQAWFSYYDSLYLLNIVIYIVAGAFFFTLPLRKVAAIKKQFFKKIKKPPNLIGEKERKPVDWSIQKNS